MSKRKFLKKKVILQKFYSQMLLIADKQLSTSFALLALLPHWFFFFDEWLNDGNMCSGFVKWSCAVKDNTIVHKS